MFKKIIFNISAAISVIVNENRAALRKLFERTIGKDIKMFRKTALILVILALAATAGMSAMEESPSKEAMKAEKPQAEQQEELRVERRPGRQAREGQLPPRLRAQRQVPDAERAERPDMPQDGPEARRRPALGAEFERSMDKLIQAYRENDREKMGQAIRELNQVRERMEDRAAMRRGQRFGEEYRKRPMRAARGGYWRGLKDCGRCPCCKRSRFSGRYPMGQQGMGPIEGRRFEGLQRPRAGVDRWDWPRLQGPDEQWRGMGRRGRRAPEQDLDRWERDDRPMRYFRW